ncbi:MAG: uroporphyrinogen decarboxylase [Candidatus Accumulibacter sp.]|uniref:uroporphyrinogen decarboxylase n=1 Tax=Candidatus Accumulibacter TaxID=327159 RepID=UPI0025876B91|nr:uroporphyrinogen decarboxylase [Accumulibacter sp.]MBK8115036.1 uroporphyrinogen decarboxylase [Accumulibacter sp.]MBK8385647.1 uroporphyrinogen decarboxylase [Accumulibacter sp.]
MTRPCNDSFLRALLKEPTEYTPVWLMRQAGRYLPEYCETRRRAGSFLQLCKNPAMACEVTLQPLARYDLDAAILFSDILTVPDAMGLGLYFSDGEGPRFERPLREEWAIRDLSAPDPWDHLRYVMDAVSEIRRALNNSVPLIGFSGSPYTLACYMVEGASSTDYRCIKSMLYNRPDLLHRILSVTADAVSAYLNAQIESGAQAVMIFDSWGGSLSAAAYQEFSLPYLRRIIATLIRQQNGERVPSIVFTKGGGLWLESIADIGCDAIGVDWTIDIGEARRRVGHQVALQGNLDPGVLFATPETIAAEAGKVLASYGADGTGHVFNLGHGISQFTPPENVTALVDAVHTRSRLLRSGTDRKSPQALDLFTETMATSGPPSGSSANPG